MARDPEHVRKYPQFQAMEEWINEGESGSLYAHFGKVVKKTALKRKRHPGDDAVSVVRKIFQGPRDKEIVIMENARAWKIEVVDHEAAPDYSGPIELSRGQLSQEPMELTPEEPAAIDKALAEGTAKPKIEIKPLPEKAPGGDDVEYEFI